MCRVPLRCGNHSLSQLPLGVGVMQHDTKITDFAVIICPHIQSDSSVAFSQLHSQFRNDALVNVLSAFVSLRDTVVRSGKSVHTASSGNSVN